MATVANVHRQSSRTNPVPSEPLGPGPERKLAAGVFAVLMLAATLLYGAVDRSVQVGLTLGLCVGFLICAPEVPKIRGWQGWVGVGLVVFVLGSQFLPAGWFGDTAWRIVLRRDYDIAFPFTRNPEPGRAVDCILMAVLAAAWFFWVRTLACDRHVRLYLVWMLFLTAAVVGAVSLALGTREDYLIYGVRYTPGWTGFGPFPNRNHTAALLAMGALAGIGCIVRAGRRRHWIEFGASVILEVVAIVALLDSKSRGGLLGLCCGMGLFAILAIWKLRTRSSAAGAVAGGLLCATLVLSYGSKVLDRFSTGGDGNIPNNVRWQIWQDAIALWQAAPLWGHGLGTFAQIFPIYQSIQAHEQVILHPESSWLLWLDELGIIPVAAGGLLLLYFLGRNAIGAVQAGDRGFFLRAGAFAGVFALLCHGIWDVPIHRWGTAAFGIALLAIACPPLHRRRQMRLGRAWAAVPAAIGAFWLLPFIGYPVDWTPETLRETLDRLEYSPTAVPLRDVMALEAAFPLNADLHNEAGIRDLITLRQPDQAWREFRVADRLGPNTWTMPVTQAWLSRDVSPAMSFHFWSLAVERAGRRAPEIFAAAYHNSVDLPGGEAYWQGYAEGHPELLLCYAQATTRYDRAQAAYDLWWQLRGQTGMVTEPWEAPDFYAALRNWGNQAQLLEWTQSRPGLEETDYKVWATILHEWRQDADAWRILTAHVTEPDFPPPRNDDKFANLEAEWRAHPDDPLSAQAYARECDATGETGKAEQVILTIATGKNPPPWFIEKAAFIYASKKDYSTAVTSMLQLSATDAQVLP